MLHKFSSLLLISLFLLAVGCSADNADSADAAEDKTENQTTTDKKELNVAAENSDPANFTYPVRDENNKIVTLETNHGKMVLELYHDVAPAHADSFAARVADEFYKDLIFHRVKDNFMIQGGDPTGTGTGNAGYSLDAEFSDKPHLEGTLSMARSQSPNSASCQFFVCLARNAQTASLDGQYSVFGHLLKGYDVLHSIGSTPTTPQDRPVEEVKIISCFASDAEGNPL